MLFMAHDIGKMKFGYNFLKIKNNNMIEINKKTDSIVESVINQIQERSNRGKNKYGTTLDRNDLSVADWVQHAQEEALDLALYLEKIKKELTKTKTNF
jgi:hypothetical protein